VCTGGNILEPLGGSSPEKALEGTKDPLLQTCSIKKERGGRAPSFFPEQIRKERLSSPAQNGGSRGKKKKGSEPEKAAYAQCFQRGTERADLVGETV